MLEVIELETTTTLPKRIGKWQEDSASEMPQGSSQDEEASPPTT